MYDSENDINRIFREDSRDKKRIGIGIHKRASRRGYCRGGIKTQSDFLTTKERKKLSGEVKVWNMYEEYKNLDNCDLNEILGKEENEIKAILGIIKDNNTCNKICAKFKISNGKLYSFYEKYGVPTQKKPQKKKKVDLGTGLLSKEKFKLMDSKSKGEYICKVMAEYSVGITQLANHWGINKNNLSYYVGMYKGKGKGAQKEVNAIEPKQIQWVGDDTVEEKKPDNAILELNNKIAELEKENKKLTSHIITISEEKVSKQNGLRIEINGEYNKEELGSRLLSLDNMSVDNKIYRIKLILEEV